MSSPIRASAHGSSGLTKMNKGLTLLELLIAVSMSAISVLGIAALQGSALQVSAQARQIQSVTRAAEAELERQRQSVHSFASAQTRSCLSSLPNHFSCTVSSYPCTFSTATLSCINGAVDASDLVAHQIKVEVAGPKAALELQTVVRQ